MYVWVWRGDGERGGCLIWHHSLRFDLMPVAYNTHPQPMHSHCFPRPACLLCCLHGYLCVRVCRCSSVFALTRSDATVAYMVGLFISGGYACFYYGTEGVPFAVADGTHSALLPAHCALASGPRGSLL